jgi:hypothetical protein
LWRKFFYYNIGYKRDTGIHTFLLSSVKWAEKVDIPGTFSLLVSPVWLVFLGLLGIYEIVGVIAQGFAHDEGTFPLGG